MLLLMYDEIVLPHKRAIKLSMNVSNFSGANLKTLSLLDFEYDDKEETLYKNIHKLRERFGLDIVKTGNEL